MCALSQLYVLNQKNFFAKLCMNIVLLEETPATLGNNRHTEMLCGGSTSTTYFWVLIFATTFQRYVSLRWYNLVLQMVHCVCISTKLLLVDYLLYFLCRYLTLDNSLITVSFPFISWYTSLSILSSERRALLIRFSMCCSFWYQFVRCQTVTWAVNVAGILTGQLHRSIDDPPTTPL